MPRLPFLLAVVLLLAYPQKSWALQSDKPPTADSDEKPKGPGADTTRPEDSDPVKAQQGQHEAERADETVNRVKTGVTSSLTESQVKRLQKLDHESESLDRVALDKLAQEARAINDGGSGGVLTLVWSEDEQKHHLVHIQRGSSPGQVIDLGDATDLTKLNRFVSTAGVTLLEGDFPANPSWHKWLSTSCKSCVLSSRRSANSAISEKTFAALLGRAVPRLRTLSAYNALPCETGAVDSVRERTRMRIEGSRQDWTAVNDRIRNALGVGLAHSHLNSISSQIAEKEPLLKELRDGEADVVLIFAHSDGSKIYMPGKSGSSISVEELRALKRRTSPNRVVILVACEAGAVNHGTHSIAEALLESKLATTVFAYPGRVSASYVPGMLARLRSGGSLRDALPGLYQIVTLRGAHDELRPSLRLRSGI